jgi:archaemetzincin
MVTGLTIVPLGTVPREIIEDVVPALSLKTGMECSVSALAIDPAVAYDSRRGQYDSRMLLPLLDARGEEAGGRILGIADVDLFSPVFTFVFGEARFRGETALFSIHRLRPTLYGLPDDPALLRSRARKEAIHETGHMLGLAHCGVPDCVMHFSAAVEEVDLKSESFCPRCEGRRCGSA